MPRTCTPTERSRISATGVNHYLKLEVADADGVMQDCSALGTLSLDLLDGAAWGETLETPVGTGTLTIRRDTNADSAAPIMGASSINRNGLGAYAPLFEKGRAIRVSTAITAPGVAPVTGDWKEMLLGRIDKVQWHANPMTIDVSDIGAWVTDAFLQTKKQYASSSTTPGSGPLLDAVVQAMLADANVKGGTPTLYVPSPVSWQPFAGQPQEPDSVMTAARALVQEIGWELRYRYYYDSGAGHDVFKLSLYEPPRSNTTADWVIGPTEYRNVTRLETSIADIRNSIRGYYNDISSVTGTQQFTTSKSDTSIAKYGERFMSISSTAIRDATNMQALTDAVLSDLSESAADQEIEMLYFWPVQIGDVITFQANGDHYDTDQTLAVVGYQHKLINGEGITTIQARGKVAGAYRQWLRRQSDSSTQDGAILRVSPSESADGTQRILTVILSPSVESLHVHNRTVPIDVSGDPFDFSGASTVTEEDALFIVRPASGSNTVTFSLAHPPRGYKIAGRLVPRLGPPSLQDGDSWPFQVDAAPPAINAKIHPSKVGAVGSLSIDIAFGVSDADSTGIQVDVIIDSIAASTTILSRKVLTPGTIDSGTDPALGAIALPAGKDIDQCRVRITDVSAEPWWFGPANLSRDPLADATATLLNYRPDPTAVVAFGPDTDAIRVTSHDGTTTTWNAAALALAGSPVQYHLGTTVRDDTSVESVLNVDETRSLFKVEAQGGGTWTTILGPVDLHGTPSNPPTATMRAVKSSDGSTEDLYITAKSPVGETLAVFYRDGDTSGAAVYQLCASNVSTAPRYVASGTEVGPTDYFVNIAGGSPVQILSAIVVRDLQVKRVMVEVKGKDSGVEHWVTWDMVMPNVAPSNATVSIDADGNWSFTADLPNNAQSCKWKAAIGTASVTPVSDATTVSSGTTANGRHITVSSGGTLNFGDTIVITVVPFTGTSATGTQLPSIQPRGSYLTFTASKTINYTPDAWTETTRASTGVLYTQYDTDGNVQADVNAAGVHQIWEISALVANGVTITQVAFSVARSGTDGTMVVGFDRKTGSTASSLGTATITAGGFGGGFQTVTIGLSESTTGNGYRAKADLVDLSTNKYLGNVAITYSMGDPKKAV